MIETLGIKRLNSIISFSEYNNLMTMHRSEQSAGQNSAAKNSWASAFAAFMDRRAAIMLFLGFSAGIPILLIFSSLSLWLGEAGIEKSAVTFFSWAALGYSFKFVWAPLVDELPVPFLTKKLGRRRAWLLIAQTLIICAICIMAMTDPSQYKAIHFQFNYLIISFNINIENWYLVQMAIGAVLLGFSAATQDIVIDAYRIELAETEMQTVLASTYNAGYRIGMIIAGAGALFLAAKLGTAKGNYIYDAWKYTYLAMAAVMVVGIITTLSISEPQVNRVDKHYKKTDYYRLVAVFALAVVSFVCCYIYSDDLVQYLQKTWNVQDSALKFLMETVRFLGSGAGAIFVATLLIRLGLVNKQMAYETWVNPITDFFQRYGVKLALVLLLLIGFYRISDIIAGVISNVFYQDLNFTKEQIAEAVKIYGVIFSLVGGFLGGLLAQRMNIMKLMFVGAILASSTNLIFIGLVKSGKPMDQVIVQVGQQKFQATPDEVGYWKVKVPSQTLATAHDLKISSQYQDQSEPANVVMPYLKDNGVAQIQLLPIARDNQLSKAELKQSVVVKGQLVGVNDASLKIEQPITLKLDGKDFPAKLDKDGIFTGSIDAQALQNSPTKNIIATANFNQENQKLAAKISYQIVETKNSLAIDVEPIHAVKADSQDATVEIKGKLIESYSSTWLYFAIIVDNMASGLAGAAFIAFLSSLTSVSFTAVQYAIFSSLMTLTPKILGGYSGTIVTHIGYPKFFLMTTLIGIPILILVLWVAKLLREHQNSV